VGGQRADGNEAVKRPRSPSANSPGHSGRPRLYRCRLKYGALKEDEAPRLKALEVENKPAVELRESGSHYMSEDARALALPLAEEVDRGNVRLARYLGQPYFHLPSRGPQRQVRPTEREETICHFQGLVGERVLDGLW
jgi:hypothetical protein